MFACRYYTLESGTERGKALEKKGDRPRPYGSVVLQLRISTLPRVLSLPFCIINTLTLSFTSVSSSHGEFGDR